MSVALFPAARSLAVFEELFFGQKSRGMKAAATGPDSDGMSLVQHLVKDDPLDVVAGHKQAIEHGVDANQTIFDRIRAHHDAAMATRHPR